MDAAAQIQCAAIGRALPPLPHTYFRQAAQRHAAAQQRVQLLAQRHNRLRARARVLLEQL